MQKNILILGFFMLGWIQVMAQSVGINTIPHPNASLDVSGTNKGLLIPRGDAATRNVLNTNTAKGLMMYDTTSSTIWVHNGNGNGSGWQSLSTGTNHWKLSGALGTEITNTNENGFWSAYSTTVLSDPGLVAPPVSGPGTRFMWIPQKSAFRVGTTDSGHWDAENIGLFSFAGGLNTIANNSYSFAMGAGTSSKALAATSLGWFTNATGQISTAIGFKTRSKSYASVALGRFNDSIAISNNTTWINSDPLLMIGNGMSESTRHNAMVVYKNGNMILKNPLPFYVTKLPVEYDLPVEGEGTRMMWLPELGAFRVGSAIDSAWNANKIGYGSFATGINATASGFNTLAAGLDTKASGGLSAAIGYANIAKGYSSMAIGMFNDPILTSDEDETAAPNSPLFMIGNGDDYNIRHNAMVVYKNGNMILKNPITVLTNPGLITTPVSGAGTRMMWLPQKSAFRVGTATGTGWNAETIGTWSFATGKNTLASGEGSSAFGTNSNALGTNSFAMNGNTIASGFHSTAMGFFTRASGAYAVTTGLDNVAKGFCSTVIGIYNDSILTVNQNTLDPISPLFIIGNGSSGQRSNAMVVRKDGRVGIGSNTPAAPLTVLGPAGIPSIPGSSSSGIVRIGLNAGEGIDIGKMTSGSFAGWIQAGIDGSLADPLSLQPVGGNVGIGTTSPANSAVLDVSSTNRGFLPPRMTFDNRNSIPSPVPGLMIWCTNCGVYGQMQIYNGSFWSNISGSPAVGLPAVGERDGGGIIAYIFQVGDPGYVPGEVHGLITTVNDVGASVDWGCNGTNVAGAAGTGIGTGNQNTTDIVNGCGTLGIAARKCYDLVDGGYSDWYLPSKDELNKLYINHVAIGGFGGEWYWASSESSSTQAWSQDFSVGTQAIQNKTFFFRVRGVRTF